MIGINACNLSVGLRPMFCGKKKEKDIFDSRPQFKKNEKPDIEAIRRFYTTKDNNGLFPIHRHRGFEPRVCITHIELSEEYKANIMLEEMNKALARETEILKEIYTAKDKSGRFFAHGASASCIAKMNEALKDSPETLVEIYTTKDNKGCLPAHYASANFIHEMHRALKNYPDKIVEIHLTQDDKGNTPFHTAMMNRDITERRRAAEEIHLTFLDDPKTLARLHTTKNKDGKQPVFKCFKTPLSSSMLCEILKEDAETLEKIYAACTKEDRKEFLSFLNRG